MITETKCALPTSTDEAIQIIGPDDEVCPKSNIGDHCNCWYDDGDDGHADWDEANLGVCCYCTAGSAEASAGRES